MLSCLLLISCEDSSELSDTLVLSDLSDFFTLTYANAYKSDRFARPEVIKKLETNLLDFFKAPDVSFLSFLLAMRVEIRQF